LSSFHFVMTAKGGVGKSWTAAVLANYFHHLGDPLYCADTDPSNQTFSGIKYFGAQHINILTPDMGLDRSQFDTLIEKLLAHEGNCVIDNGSSSFLPILAYMMENNLVDLLQAEGHKVYIHVVVVGGSGMNETMNGVEALLDHQSAELVVWLNEYYDGPVIKAGRSFEESELYLANKNRFAGIIHVPQRSTDTYGKDLSAMSVAKQSFTEAINSPKFQIMQRHRLKQVYMHLHDQLEQIEF
jgi:hypothetical protein